jgi:predicted CXXCH cytochrome family protein
VRAQLQISRKLLLIVGAVVLMGLGSALAATKAEERDSNCASCHSEPETTYVQRAQNPHAHAVDLASAHAHVANNVTADTNAIRCIDCHSGPGFMGRAKALTLGARDAFRWFTNTATQPALTTVPIADENCIKCHTDTPTDTRFDKHFHGLLAQWQAQDVRAGRCVACHTAHTTDGNAAIGFLQQQRTQQVCDQCHKKLVAVSN